MANSNEELSRARNPNENPTYMYTHSMYKYTVHMRKAQQNVHSCKTRLN